MLEPLNSLQADWRWSATAFSAERSCWTAAPD